jgi:hypothetical protein
MFIMVLNDGETFTSLEGCKLVCVPDESAETEDIEELLDTLENETWDLRKVYVVRTFSSQPEFGDFG